jgi:hypothetical protein
MQIPPNEFAGTTICGGTIQLPAAWPALDWRGVVALNVPLYLGLPSFELPFRENLSEGSVLFVEYFFYSILGRMTLRVKRQIEIRHDCFCYPAQAIGIHLVVKLAAGRVRRWIAAQSSCVTTTSQKAKASRNITSGNIRRCSRRGFERPKSDMGTKQPSAFRERRFTGVGVILGHKILQ